MKKILILIATYAGVNLMAQNTSWVNTYVSPKYIHINNVHTDKDGNILQCGQWKGTMDLNPEIGEDIRVSEGIGDMFLQKTDAQGHVLWTKTFKSSRYILNQDMTTDADNNIILCGAFMSNMTPNPSIQTQRLNSNASQETGYVLKLDKDGIFMWAHTIYSPLKSAIKSVAIDKDNEIVVAGFFYDSCSFSNISKNGRSKGKADIFILKMNAKGLGLWANLIGGEGDDVANNMSFMGNGHFLVSGTFQDTLTINTSQTDTLVSTGDFSSFIMQVDGLGRANWVKAIKSTGFVDLRSTDTDTFGNICGVAIYTGTLNVNNKVLQNNLPSMLLFKMNSVGTILQHKPYASTRGLGYAHVRMDVSNNQLIIAAMYNGSCLADSAQLNSQLMHANGVYNLMLLEIDQNLDLKSHFSIGSIGNDYVNDLSVDVHGNMYVAGAYEYDLDFNRGGKPMVGNYKLVDKEAFVFKRQSCTFKEGLQNIKACNKYTWINGQTYKNSTTATYLLPGQDVCDSLVTLQLQIDTIPMDISRVGDSLIASSGTFQYQWLDCNNNYEPINTELKSAFVPKVKGKYAVEINNGQCVDTSVCINYWSLDLVNKYAININVTPNPNSGTFKITLPQNNMTLS